MDHPRWQVLRCSIVTATASLLIFFAAAPASAEPWPIRNFQVVEMTDAEIDKDTGGVFNDAVGVVVGVFSDDVAGDPARAGQRAQIERYLGKVAGQLQAWGFPPPKLGRVVELENGELAYRVYSLASVGASKYIPSNGGDGANAGSLRLHLSDIRLSQDLDFEDYATIAHELFHAVQFNTRFYSVNPLPPPVGIGDWITEGQAEAVGEDLAWAHAPPGASRDAMDWGRRDYARPLPIARRNPGGTGDAYETASFWRYLAERDHLNLTAGPKVLPGIAAPKGAVHYGYLASLLSNPPQPRDCRTNDDRCPLEIQWLDAGLRGYDNFQQPLRKFFPDFAVTMAAYADPGGRAQAGSDASGLGADHWRSGVLDCVKEIVDGPILEYKTTLRLKGISARCIVIPDFFNAQAEVVVQARAGSSDLLDQVVFGLAGDPKGAAPVLTTKTRAQGQTSAILPVRLVQGRDNVLVFANVALDAPRTQDQDLEITFLLEHASMGRSRNRAANASPADLPSVAAAIDAPLEIELTKYRATMMREKYKQSGETFVGLGHAAGVERPCLLQLSGESDRRPGAQYSDRLILMMRTSGPITAGKSYPMENSEKIRSLSDLGADVAFVGVMMPGANGKEYPFDIQNGTLQFDSVAGHLLVGNLAGDGVYREYSRQTLHYEVRKVQKIVVKFAIRVKSAFGSYKDEPYACLASAGGG